MEQTLTKNIDIDKSLLPSFSIGQLALYASLSKICNKLAKEGKEYQLFLEFKKEDIKDFESRMEEWRNKQLPVPAQYIMYTSSLDPFGEYQKFKLIPGNEYCTIEEYKKNLFLLSFKEHDRKNLSDRMQDWAVDNWHEILYGFFKLSKKNFYHIAARKYEQIKIDNLLGKKF